MPRASDFPLLLPAIREDLRDYRIPGWHLHGPLARGVARLPSGRQVTTPDDGGTIPGFGDAPSVMLWPFSGVNATPNAPTVVSPRITGPAILDVIHASFQHGNVGPLPWVAVGYNTTGLGQAVEGAGAFADVARTLFTTQSSATNPPVADSFQIEAGIPKLASTLERTNFNYPIGAPIDEAFFHLVIRVHRAGAGTVSFMGYARIVHNLTREQFRNFL